jgi:hypothetical protein
MAPSRAAAYPHHAQECLRLADLMTISGLLPGRSLRYSQSALFDLETRNGFSRQ